MSAPARTTSWTPHQTLLLSILNNISHGILGFAVVQLFRYCHAFSLNMQPAFDEIDQIFYTVAALLLTEIITVIVQQPSSKGGNMQTAARETPKQLAERAISNHLMLEKLRAENASLNIQISKVHKSEKQATILRSEVASLKASLKKANTDLNDRAKAAKDANTALKSLQAQRNIDKITKQVANADAAHVQQLLRDKQDLQFEIEMLKVTSQQVSTAQPEAFPQPFVLVMIDGDAYSFAIPRPPQQDVPAGSSMAVNIRRAVQQHVMAHQSQVSIHSKIVTRVFLNEGNYDGLPFDFARTFTEHSTLFDVMNCGRGKERVDHKIHDNFNLFIANPLCQRIFLAAATDAGFARLLEPYVADKAARDKIVLVHPGYVIREMEELGLNSEEWPNVFKKRFRPFAAAKHDKVVTLARENRKEAHQRAVDQQIVEGFTRAGILKIPDWLARQTSTMSRVKEELEHHTGTEPVVVDDVD